ncbi:MAG: hypothetical protein WDZ66_00835 [Steroidobacteraceae bacterium]
MANRKSRIAKTATQALTILWEEGFLRAWKKSGAIEAHLAKRRNNFSGPELGMALKRAKHLTRKGKHGGYEYIQKHPFDAEDAAQAIKKTKRE